MDVYPKIETMFKRDMADKGRIMIDQWACPEFKFLKDCQWKFTEKVNGTNIRVHWDGEKLRYGGKTDNSSIPVKLIYALNDLFGYVDWRKEFEGAQVTLYGEGYGPKIQKGGGNYRDNVSFVLFDVYISPLGEDFGLWLERNNVADVAHKLGITVVPSVGIGTLMDAVKLCQEGFNSRWGDFRAEGIVARPYVELFDRRGRRIITKVKCKDFKDA